MYSNVFLTINVIPIILFAFAASDAASSADKKEAKKILNELRYDKIRLRGLFTDFDDNGNIHDDEARSILSKIIESKRRIKYIMPTLNDQQDLEALKAARKDVSLKGLTNDPVAVTEMLEEDIKISLHYPAIPTKEETRKRQKVNKALNKIQKSRNTLKQMASRGKSNLKDVQPYIHDVLNTVKELIKSMKRDALQVMPSMKLLHYRANEKRIDLNSILYDVEELKLILTQNAAKRELFSYIGALHSTNQILKSQVDSLRKIAYTKEDKELFMRTARYVFFYQQCGLKWIFSRYLFREVPDGLDESLEKAQNNITTPADVATGTKVVDQLIKSMLNFYRECYIIDDNRFERVDELTRNVTIGEFDFDPKSQKLTKELDDSIEDFLSLMYYSKHEEKKSLEEATKLARKCSNILKNLSQASGINDLSVYSRRVETIIADAENREDFEKIISILQGAINEVKSKIRHPFDYHIASLWRWCDSIPMRYFVRGIRGHDATEIGPDVVETIRHTAWELAHEFTVKGIDDFNDNTMVISRSLRHETNMLKVAELLTRAQNLTYKLIRDNSLAFDNPTKFKFPKIPRAKDFISKNTS